MNKLKIAVITTVKHNQPGGISTYNRMIYDSFDKIHFTEFPTLDIYSGQDDDKLIKKNVKINTLLYGKNPKIMWSSTYKQTKLEYIYKNFDIVILSHLDPPKSYINNKKSIFIQHEDISFYSFNGRRKIRGFGLALGQAFSSVLFGNGFIKNPFRKASNVIFFTKETSTPIKGNSFFIPLPNDVDGENYEKRNGALWAARMDYMKNIPILSKILKKDIDIDIYGQKNKLSKKYNIPTKGYINRDLLLEEMNKKRVFLVTSKSEGFIFTVVEALSSGMAVILFDTFSAVQFFDKCESVFVINPWDVKKAVKKIEYINNMTDEEFKYLSLKSYNFSKKHFSLNSFKEEWELILNKFIK